MSEKIREELERKGGDGGKSYSYPQARDADLIFSAEYEVLSSIQSFSIKHSVLSDSLRRVMTNLLVLHPWPSTHHHSKFHFSSTIYPVKVQ